MFPSRRDDAISRVKRSLSITGITLNQTVTWNVNRTNHLNHVSVLLTLCQFCVHKNFVCTDRVRKTLSKHDTCHCLRSCYENFYITTKSFGKLLPNSIPKQINIPEGSSVESTTIVHFFFTKSSYSKLFKSELFAFTDIVI
ncbi:unnamed protein product [Callosobruchus maculatus]|uniref:Uncharacterized protein n=1 Tax=Callosobruchus maculatus TaxID=64391 RepID=A0A653BFE8_CALMS|nr:unnamed protein product [Callosobruchus maculatus]